LSHALAVSLGASLPFAIGREPAAAAAENAAENAADATAVAASDVGDGDAASARRPPAAHKANDLVLNGMGIAPHHCVFKYTDEDDRGSLSVRALAFALSRALPSSPCSLRF
jgi:hypothetical protein